MTELSYGAPPPRRRKRIFLWLLGLLALYLVWEAVTWPDVAALTHAHPKTTAFIEQYRGWGIFGPKKKVEWVWVPYSRISPSLKRAVLVNEDMRFFPQRLRRGGDQGLPPGRLDPEVAAARRLDDHPAGGQEPLALG